MVGFWTRTSGYFSLDQKILLAFCDHQLNLPILLSAPAPNEPFASIELIRIVTVHSVACIEHWTPKQFRFNIPLSEDF